MQLVIISPKANNFESIIRQGVDNVQITTMTSSADFINTASYKSIVADKILLFVDALNMDELRGSAIEMANFLYSNMTATRVVVIAPDTEKADVVAQFFSMGNNVVIVPKKADVKFLWDIAMLTIEELRGNYKDCVYGADNTEVPTVQLNKSSKGDKKKVKESKKDKKNKKKLRGSKGRQQEEDNVEVVDNGGVGVTAPIVAPVNMPMNTSNEDDIFDSMDSSFDFGNDTVSSPLDFSNFDSVIDNGTQGIAANSNNGNDFVADNSNMSGVNNGVGGIHNAVESSYEGYNETVGDTNTSNGLDFSQFDNDSTVNYNSNNNKVENYGTDNNNRGINEAPIVDLGVDLNYGSDTQGFNNADNYNFNYSHQEANRVDNSRKVESYAGSVSLGFNDIYEADAQLKTELGTPIVDHKKVILEIGDGVSVARAMKGEAIKYIVITGGSNIGKTTLALNVVKQVKGVFGRRSKGKVLYLDLDNVHCGAQFCMGLEDISSECDNVRNSLNVIKKTSMIKEIAYYHQKLDMYYIGSEFGSTPNDESIKDIDEVIRNQKAYNLVIVDCPIDKLKYIKRILGIAEVWILVTNDLHECVDTIMDLDRFSEDPETIENCLGRADFVVRGGPEGEKEVKNNMRYICDLFDLQDNNIDFTAIGVRGCSDDLMGLLGIKLKGEDRK